MFIKKWPTKLASIQQDDGLWRSSLLDPDSYPGGEASGSGFNIYALAWGINQGVLDSEPYLEVVKKGWIRIQYAYSGQWQGWLGSARRGRSTKEF